MTKERFAEILKEYDFSDHQINLLWNSRPQELEDLDEVKLRRTVKEIAPMKDRLTQA